METNTTITETKTTTLKLNAADLLILLNSIEGTTTDHMDDIELAEHDKMHTRLAKALGRVDV